MTITLNHTIVWARDKDAAARLLRVADASVMPSIISGPGTNAAAYMIGGRAAQFIKADIS